MINQSKKEKKIYSNHY